MTYTTPHHIPKYKILQKKKLSTIPLQALNWVLFCFLSDQIQTVYNTFASSYLMYPWREFSLRNFWLAVYVLYGDLTAYRQFSHHTDSTCIRTGTSFKNWYNKQNLNPDPSDFHDGVIFSVGFKLPLGSQSGFYWLFLLIQPCYAHKWLLQATIRYKLNTCWQHQVATLQLTGALCWPCSTSNYATICSRKTMHIAIVMRTSIVTTATTRMCWFTQ